MNLKQKALIQTLKMIVTATAIGVAIGLLFSYLSTQVLLYGLLIAFISYMFYVVYKINLTQLEYREKLQETVDQIRS